MPVTLPVEPVEASLFSPKVTLLYGMPKIGKTKIATMLDIKKTLILQGDPRGNDMYTCMSLPLHTYSYGNWKELLAQITSAGEARHKAGMEFPEVYPYRYIVLDNITVVQEMARKSLTAEYLAVVDKTVAAKRTETQNNAKADPNFVITDLPYASGTYQLRERVKKMIEDLAEVCHKLIIIAHVKDKEMTTMENVLVKVQEIALDGKLGEIVASRVDAIGFLYRDKDGKLMVNFKTNERSTMGSRFRYLAGKTFEFSWETMFPDEFGIEIPES